MKLLDEPRPVPRDGMSATVVISTPPGTPAMFSAARTSWCSISETELTSSTRE